MTFLLDTQLLLWTAFRSEALSANARAILSDEGHRLLFSAASLWEVAIKNGLGRADFRIDPRVLRRGLTDNGYEELPITGTHAAAVTDLPPIHKDPFDRLLIAQATAEGVTLLTADAQLAGYPGPVQQV